MKSLATASNCTMDTAAPESSKALTGECFIKPLMHNILLIHCMWWLTTTIILCLVVYGRLSFTFDSMLAHSLKGSFWTNGVPLHNYSTTHMIVSSLTLAPSATIGSPYILWIWRSLWHLYNCLVTVFLPRRVAASGSQVTFGVVT